MSSHAVDARVKTATLTGIVQNDTGSWPAANYYGDDCDPWLSDNSGAVGPKLSLVTDILAMTFTCRRAGSPVLVDGGFQDVDFQVRVMAGVIGSFPGYLTCHITGAMRDGEMALDNLLFTANSDQMDIRFGTPVQGVGCYAQLNSQAPYTARMRAYDSGGALLLSVIKTGTSTNAYSSGIFEAAVWLGIAYDAADAANIARIDVNVVSGTISPLDDATFNAGSEARFHCGQLIFGPYDPLIVLLSAGIPGVPLGECGPALFSAATCLPAVDATIFSRSSIGPAPGLLLPGGIPSVPAGVCGHPLASTPCAPDEVLV